MELAKEILQTCLSAQAQASPEQSQRLWLDLDHDLGPQLQEAEVTTKLQLEGLRAQLEQDGQVDTLLEVLHVGSWLLPP